MVPVVISIKLNCFLVIQTSQYMSMNTPLSHVTKRRQIYLVNWMIHSLNLNCLKVSCFRFVEIDCHSKCCCKVVFDMCKVNIMLKRFLITCKVTVHEPILDSLIKCLHQGLTNYHIKVTCLSPYMVNSFPWRKLAKIK